MDWLNAVMTLSERNQAGVIATLADVRGHSPRNSGAKIVISSDEIWGTIGGGNFEASVIDRARELIEQGANSTEIVSFALNDRVTNTHGVQCCGGEIKVLLEVLNPRRTVAIFGLGHVGLEIAHILSRQPLNLILVDSRESSLVEDRVGYLRHSLAKITVRHEPAPEVVLTGLPCDATVLILTHDHSEDLVLSEAALRAELFYIGLIGSKGKWARFQKKVTGRRSSSVGNTAN